MVGGRDVVRAPTGLRFRGNDGQLEGSVDRRLLAGC